MGAKASGRCVGEGINLGKGSTMLGSLLPIRNLALVYEILGSRGLRACLPEAALSP